jgi:hypothetical protein
VCQVADVFEQLATTVADSTQASIAQLVTQQQEVSRETSGVSSDGLEAEKHPSLYMSQAY